MWFRNELCDWQRKVTSLKPMEQVQKGCRREYHTAFRDD